MNRNVAITASIVVSILLTFIVFKTVHLNFPRGGDANGYLALSIVSMISGGLSMYVQSKKENIKLENIVYAVLLNFVGVAISLYAIFTKQYNKA